MDTTTEAPPPAEEHQHRAQSASQVAEIDPEHDIDAKKTFFWLAACLLFVVITMIVLAKTFAFAVQGQQYKVIETLPPVELRQLRSDEDYLLKKQQPVGAVDERDLAEIDQSIRQTTDAVIEAYLK